MACENITITIEEVIDNISVTVQQTVENVTVVINDFSISNIVSDDAGNQLGFGLDGLLFVPEPGGVENHSELNLDDGSNPHGTTKSDVGLGNVPNFDTTDAVNNQHTHTNKNVLDLITEAFTIALKTAYDSTVTWIATNGTNLINHLSNFSNPHNVTKSQVGLGDVDNTSDANKPVSIATQTALNGLMIGFSRFISPTFTPAASTTYFFADGATGLFGTPSTSSTNRRITAMATGRFKKAHIAMSAGSVMGGSSNLAFHLDNLTQSTTVQLTSTLSAAVNFNSQNVDIDFAVTRGDLITLRVVTPAFSAAPTNFNVYCDLTIEK